MSDTGEMALSYYGKHDKTGTHGLTEGQWLSEFRRDGRDKEFQAYLAGRRMRIVGAVLTKPLVPFVERLSRKLAK